MEVLWIDGLVFGLFFGSDFVGWCPCLARHFVFCSHVLLSIPPYCPTWLLTYHYLVIGILNVVLSLSIFVGIFDHHDNKFTDMFILEGSTNMSRVYMVSHDGFRPVEVVQCWSCWFRLQTMMHSILSTWIMLHTGRVLRQDVAHTQLPTNMHENGHRIRPDLDGAVELKQIERRISGIHEDLWVHTVIVRVAWDLGRLDPTATYSMLAQVVCYTHRTFINRGTLTWDLVCLQCNY